MRKHLKAWPRHSLTQSVPKYVKPSEPIKWAFVCFWMVPDSTRCYPMVPFSTHWYPIVPNGIRWYQMVLNDTKWYPMLTNAMVPNGTQWSSVTKMNLYMLAEWLNAVLGQSNFRPDTFDRNFGMSITEILFYFLFVSGGCHSQKWIYVFLRDGQMQARVGQTSDRITWTKKCLLLWMVVNP